ncbi:hypothetical protein FIBSPDRAFT_957178 [Athelia psychrophila]|uniref:Uncharacterized protein n=1 Tax=Athelia psychrophila TaxID=1759441 RepID=A0A166G0K2_9AGAM|nr:hypothetical protein FIBSPDRAFT_957178 [Fibularhizoctonia sp. CBS 109695]
MQSRGSLFSVLSHIPPEIWEYTFESLITDNDSTDPDVAEQLSISSIRLTCRTFAILARPVAFQHFVFRPFVCQESSDTPHLFLPKGFNVRRSSARLQAWASLDIAPHVRRVSIQPASWDGLYTKEGDGEHLLDAFFRVLPRFSLAIRVDCAGFPCDGYRLGQLNALPRLQHLSVQKCMITTDSGQLPSGLLKRVVTLGYNTGYTGDFSKDYHTRTTKWLGLTRHDTVHDIQLALHHLSAATAFLHALSAISATQLLTTLIMPGDNELVELLVETLGGASEPPFLRSLSLFVRRGTPHRPWLYAGPKRAAGLKLRMLQEYTGSPYFLSQSVLIPHAPTLLQLRLYVPLSPGNNLSTPSYIESTLRDLCLCQSESHPSYPAYPAYQTLSLSGLTCLRVDVAYLPASLLAAVAQACPALEKLYVNASPGEVGARMGREVRRETHADLVRSLLTKPPLLPLPPRLRLLALGFEYYPAERSSVAAWTDTAGVKDHLFSAVGLATLGDLHVKFNSMLDVHWMRKKAGDRHGSGFESSACHCRLGEGMEVYTTPPLSLDGNWRSAAQHA